MTAVLVVSGWLLDRDVLATVLGADVPTEPVQIKTHALIGALSPELIPPLTPPLIPAATSAQGRALPKLTADQAERLAFFAGSPQEITLGDGRVALGLCGAQPADTDAPWDFAAQWALQSDLILEAVRQHMAGFGQISAAVALARWPMVLVRASSTLRARASGSPAQLRRSAGAGDVEVKSLTLGYAKFFAVEDYVLTHTTFAGGVSAPLSRAAFISGDAVVILPYDPARDLVLLVEQFRAGLFARGDRNPWSLEGVAGRIDGGETPEEAGRREGEEEAGVAFSALLKAPGYYPSPGAKSEFLYNFVGLCDLGARPSGGGGLDEEGEDIRSHLIPFQQMMDLIESGEINNGPLVVLAYWLARERDKIRAL